MGRRKDSGVDCGQLLLLVYENVGLAPTINPGYYPESWFQHQSEELYMAWIARYCARAEAALSGDIILYRFGRTASHGAIAVDDNYMIHCYKPAGGVEVRERRAPLVHGSIDSFWTLKDPPR